MEKPGDSGLKPIPDGQEKTDWPTMVVEGGVPEKRQLVTPSSEPTEPSTRVCSRHGFAEPMMTAHIDVWSKRPAKPHHRHPIRIRMISLWQPLSK